MVEESMQQADPSGSQDEAQASPYGRPPMAPPERWRILVALSAGQGPEEKLQCSTSGSAASELEGCSQAEVRTLVHASVAEIEAACRDFAPNLVYIRGACVGAASSPSSLTVASYRAASPDGMAVDGDSAEGGVAVDAAALCAAVCDSTRPLHCLYLDFQGADAAAAEAHQTGAATMAVAWASAPAPAAAPAALFARAFFASLRHPGAAVQEAYALALATTYAQCARSSGAARVAPSVPLFLHNSPPQLPGPVSVPLSTISGMHPRVIVPAFDTIRLATPRADARLLLAGAAGVSEVPRLACVAEALRAALVMEARGAKVLSAHAPTVTLFSPDVSAVQCSVQTAGGAVVEVLLCGDAGALANETARDHALRQCLAADAMHVQLRVPPRGGQFLGSRKSTAVAAGADTVEVISVMSVWCAHCLEQLAARRDARLLPALGVAAVLGTPTASFTAADAELFAAALAFSSAGVPEAPADAPGDKLVGAHGQVLPLPPTFLANGLNAALSSKGQRMRAAFGAGEGPGLNGGAGAGGGVGSIPMLNGRIYYEAAGLQKRPPLNKCTEEQFLADLIAFMKARKPSDKVDASSFPETVLNGSKLDLFSLYREVVARGGFKVGNGINWKGQIFPRMKNYTENNKMTGVGNALKKHYRNFLQAYEECHPEDLTSDRCAYCGGGEEMGQDWVACVKCNNWVHFQCDKRGSLGSFKDYAKDAGIEYVCLRCAGE